MEAKPPTTFYAPCRRIVVIGDVHGDLWVLIQALRGAGVINQNLQWTAQPPDTTVVQLGDQVDSALRGNISPWEKIPDIDVLLFMNHLASIAAVHGGKVISLIGNHELMNVFGSFEYVSPTSMALTGGQLQRRARFAPGGDIALLLAQRPVVVRIGSFVFCHAGLLPDHIRKINGRIDMLNIVMYKVLRRFPIFQMDHEVLQEVIISMEGMLWTRKYFEALQKPEEMSALATEVTTLLNCKAIVVGHTVMEHITPVSGGRIWFTDVGMSRSFGESQFVEVLEIWDDGVDLPENDNACYRVLRVPLKKN